MSCQCNPAEPHKFPCPCDSFVHPLPLSIGAGLTQLPRQIAGFAEFRKAMLYTLRPKLLEPVIPASPVEDPTDRYKHALDFWRAKQQDDLGLMLLEMWAYMCDTLSFYDLVIAHEEYLRTARRRPSLRRLVGLTGYLPAPAVGSFVWLNALAEGKLKIKLPIGTAFRSTAFEGSPPQVFETDDVNWIHPFTSKWTVRPPQPDHVITSGVYSLHILPKMAMRAGAPLLISDVIGDGNTSARLITSIENKSDERGIRYIKINLAQPLTLPAGYSFTKLELLRPAQSAGLWTTSVPDAPPSLDKNRIVLDGLYRQIRSGQYITISHGNFSRWFKVHEVNEVIRKLAGDKIVIGSIEYNTPGISMPATALTLDQDINDSNKRDVADIEWDDSIKGSISVHYAMEKAGTIMNPPKSTLSDNDQILFHEKLEDADDLVPQEIFFLSDKNTRSVKVNAALNHMNSSLLPASHEKWDPELRLPVQVFGNAISASRGETVKNEILGSGNGSSIHQTFKLRKKPLTYFPAPTTADDRGLKSTLQIHVNGVQWKEVPTFYKRTGDEPIFIVRQNDEGECVITFGDGIRGRRLPTGIDNVLATYRFGAGKKVPPANTITQISKGITGLSGINNPQEAFGGDDAETAEDLRDAAPKSILTLGRIVSIGDVNAVAQAFQGIRAIQSEWRWQQDAQGPMIHVWFIGSESLAPLLVSRLRSMSDPSTIIHAEPAEAITSSLEIDIEVDPRYIFEDVVRNVRDAFLKTETGILTPERIGIGQPLFQSKIFITALQIEGVVSVRNIIFNQQPFDNFGRTPGVGKYFDFENGSFICQ